MRNSELMRTANVSTLELGRIKSDGWRAIGAIPRQGNGQSLGR